MDDRQPVVGQSIKFMNELRQIQDALITAVHGEVFRGESGEVEYFPCVNIVIVSVDPNKRDAYGSQIERHSSVVHRSSNSYHEKVNGQPIGMTWQFHDEEF